MEGAGRGEELAHESSARRPSDDPEDPRRSPKTRKKGASANPDARASGRAERSRGSGPRCRRDRCRRASRPTVQPS